MKIKMQQSSCDFALERERLRRGYSIFLGLRENLVVTEASMSTGTVPVIVLNGMRILKPIQLLNDQNHPDE